MLKGFPCVSVISCLSCCPHRLPIHRGGTLDLFVMGTDGDGQANLTDNPSLDSFDAAWSPDGQSLGFTARGHTVDPSLGQSFGVASIVLQAALLVGLVLLVARRWRLPPGTFTGVLTPDAPFFRGARRGRRRGHQRAGAPTGSC